jgi:hypothetical protein
VRYVESIRSSDVGAREIPRRRIFASFGRDIQLVPVAGRDTGRAGDQSLPGPMRGRPGSATRNTPVISSSRRAGCTSWVCGRGRWWRASCRTGGRGRRCCSPPPGWRGGGADHDHNPPARAGADAARVGAEACVIVDEWAGFGHAAALRENAPRLPEPCHRAVIGKPVGGE